MSDTNNIFSKGIKSSDMGSTETHSYDFSETCFRALSQKFQNSLSIGIKNGMESPDRPMGRPRSYSNQLANISDDNSVSNGWNASNGWNSYNRVEARNRYNSSECPIPEWIGIKTSNDQNVRPGMRAIKKLGAVGTSDVVYTTAPIEDNGTVNGTMNGTGNSTTNGTAKDWYSTFVEQTQRFAQINGKSDKQNNERHVHFQDNNESWNSGLDDSLQSTSYTPMKSSNNLINGSDMNDNPIDDNTGKDWKSDSIPIRRDSLDSSSETYLFPKPTPKRSIMDSFCNDILRPVANNFHHNTQYMAQQWNQNMSHIQNTLNSSTIFGDSIWGNPLNPNNSIYRIFNEDDGKSKLHKLLTSVRKVIPKHIAPTYTWSGQLPRRIRTKTPVYSCKVFLGGIPYDLTDSDLHCTFAQFGHIQIQWPGKEIRSAIEGAAANKAGYVYIIFETYDNVAALLNSCTISYRDMDSGCRWYYNISSRRQKSKEVQVIPFDIGDRFFMKSSFSGQMEHSRTVFVGALHGMLAADGLAKVMDDLFGGVIFAGLDTDKHKYPLGSGRVTFDNQESFLKAVSAAFVEIKSARFKKKIQIDPYIESESMCVVCRNAVQNPIYCREESLYFCPQCWQSQHLDPESANHRPIVKNKSTKA